MKLISFRPCDKRRNEEEMSLPAAPVMVESIEKKVKLNYINDKVL